MCCRIFLTAGQYLLWARCKSNVLEMAESENTFSFVKEGEYNLILGNSLSNKKKDQDRGFHTVRYDFKPASVDSTKPVSLVIGDKNNVTVEVPHVQDSGSTVYNGSKRQCQKEFLLIIDKKAQTFTLERIGSNMQVKKIRSSSKSVKSQPSCSSTSKSSSETTNTRTKNIKSKSPVKEVLPSFSSSTPLTASTIKGTTKTELEESDSSSSSSDSSSGSESETKNDDGDDDDDDDDDDDEIDDKHVKQLNSILNCLGPEPYNKPPEFNQLSQDLHLSESGSDSD